MFYGYNLVGEIADVIDLFYYLKIGYSTSISVGNN